MVFKCVLYGNYLKMHGIIILSICAGQWSSMQVNVKTCPGGDNWYENYIHRIFTTKVRQRVILY